MVVITIQVGDLKIGNDERKAINKVLDSGRISEGNNVREFEYKWAKFVGTNYSVSTSSGTGALLVGLNSLIASNDFNVEKNSKVITTPLTYASTVNAIKLSNLSPVFVDIDYDTFVITPENIKMHLESVDDLNSYSLLLPVHLMGYACDMNEINKISKKYGLHLVEDSAQAHGTIYDNKRTGSMSDLSIFSFYIAHNIQVGEMGAINTNNKDLAELCKQMKSNGRVCGCLVCNRNEGKCPNWKNSDEDIDPRFTHDQIGYNFKTMEFQGALAVSQLKNVEKIIKKRNENVKYLNEGLEEFSDFIKLPKYSKNISYLAYPLLIKDPDKIKRNKLRLKLENEGIETRPLFGSIPTQQPAYSDLKTQYQNKLPNADFIGKNAFYIGCHQYLSNQDLDHIISSFKKILSNLS